jgi:hypothetical protein
MTAPLTIVSAADRAFFRSLLQLAASLRRHVDVVEARCVMYDLGLTPHQRGILACRFPFVEQRTFDFASYPSFVRLRPGVPTTFAWKPLLIRHVVRDSQGPVLWLDSATVVCASLDGVVAWAAGHGVYAAFGGAATIGELTHPSTLDALGADARVRSLRQRGAGVLCLDATRPAVRQLVDRWADACLDERVIAPAGSTLEGHRFDQSVLNILLARESEMLLPDDELDISSHRPTPVFRARNKVHPAIPFWLDPLVRAWFVTYRSVDVALWRLKRVRAGQ